MTSSNGNIFRVTGPMCGEFTGPGEFPAQRPVTRSFNVFFDLRPNKRLSKQPWGWWFEAPSWSLWRQCNGVPGLYSIMPGKYLCICLQTPANRCRCICIYIYIYLNRIRELYRSIRVQYKVWFAYIINSIDAYDIFARFKIFFNWSKHIGK